MAFTHTFTGVVLCHILIAETAVFIGWGEGYAFMDDSIGFRGKPMGLHSESSSNLDFPHSTEFSGGACHGCLENFSRRSRWQRFEMHTIA